MRRDRPGHCLCRVIVLHFETATGSVSSAERMRHRWRQGDKPSLGLVPPESSAGLTPFFPFLLAFPFPPPFILVLPSLLPRSAMILSGSCLGCLRGAVRASRRSTLRCCCCCSGGRGERSRRPGLSGRKKKGPNEEDHGRDGHAPGGASLASGKFWIPLHFGQQNGFPFSGGRVAPGIVRYRRGQRAKYRMSAPPQNHLINQ